MWELYGVDVSNYQSTTGPGGKSYDELARTCKFAMVRLSYGTYKDPAAVQHFKNFRAVGIQVGGYHFFRSTQSVADQLTVFNAQAADCGYLPGDIAPSLDIEDDPRVATVSPSWVPQLREFMACLLSTYGEAMPYLTQYAYNILLKPSFILVRPLWVPYWVNSSNPASPGGVTPAIWQRRVGPYVFNGEGGVFKPQLIDQNVAHNVLPLARTVAKMPVVVPHTDTPPLHTEEDLWKNRLDSITNDAWSQLNLKLEPDDYETYDGDGKVK